MRRSRPPASGGRQATEDPLVLFPPALWVLSLPIFDFIAFLQPLTKSDWALGLAILPIFLPLMFRFAMTLGYVLLFLGYVLVASAMGENDHPPPATVGDVAVARADLRQLVRNRTACLAFDGASV